MIKLSALVVAALLQTIRIRVNRCLILKVLSFYGNFASWFVRMFLKFLRTASEAIVTIFHARPLFVSLYSSSFRMMLVLSFPPYVSTLCGVNLAFFCLLLATFRVRSQYG